MIASLVMLPLIHFMIMRQIKTTDSILSESINMGYYGGTNNIMN